MPLYRVFRMKDSPRQQFRWAPHVSGPANAKPKDFEPAGQVEALHEYDAWRVLRESGEPLVVGDLLETEDGQLAHLQVRRLRAGAVGGPGAEAREQTAATRGSRTGQPVRGQQLGALYARHSPGR